MGQISYALCAITSLACFLLLLRSYLHTRVKLLLWSSLCFSFFSIQNTLLFVDLVIVPQIDLSFWRILAGFIAAMILLLAQIWENR